MKYVSLSPRHLALLSGVAANKTAEEISDATGLPVSAVVEGLAEAVARLGVDDPHTAAYVVSRLGLIDKASQATEHCHGPG